MPRFNMTSTKGDPINHRPKIRLKDIVRFRRISSFRLMLRDRSAQGEVDLTKTFRKSDARVRLVLSMATAAIRYLRRQFCLTCSAILPQPSCVGFSTQSLSRPIVAVNFRDQRIIPSSARASWR
jgi:hypothetical protein